MGFLGTFEMALSTARTRNVLSLKKKVEVLTVAEKNPQIGVRRLAELFSCGKTQISTILKNKESIFELFEGNVSSDSVSCQKRSQPCEFADVNEALYKWYLM